MAQLYRRPCDYELEHANDGEDVGFYVDLARRLKPQLVIELACGTGRITMPLAEEGSRSGFDVIGLDNQPSMLSTFRQTMNLAPPAIRERVKLIEGDMRDWRVDRPSDLIVIACSSLSHLTELRDHLRVWDSAWRALAVGGRFVVEISMAELSAFAQSIEEPNSQALEIDLDSTSPDGTRIIRQRTIKYFANNQRSRTRFVYDKFQGDRSVERYIDDFESHVFFPRELELLFIHAGFEIESIWGDYRSGELTPSSQVMIVVGRKPR